ncbi:MAG: hypothetical protein HYS13_04195 [Planctomycetia bacterium]|nr:hypothetical protein [Planctomycetia bacterium]
MNRIPETLLGPRHWWPVAIIALCLLASGGQKPQGASAAISQDTLAALGKDSGNTGGLTPSARQGWEPSEDLVRLCDREAARWRARLGKGCSTVARPPFVLAGDLARDDLDVWHETTVRPAAEILWARYARIRPHEPVVILLFASENRYRTEAKRLFADRNVSVYGYYKPSRRCIVLNLARGGGTLVHELTHALVDFDFPDVPDWFSEGLASLHEECRIVPEEARIEGLVNWRLAALQTALQQDRLRPVRALVTSGDFLAGDVGLNYAHARYVCLFLQKRGALTRFYHAFRDRRAIDPPGASTLLAATGSRSWEELESEFRDWVAQLQ